MPIQFTLNKTLHTYDIQQIELAEESNTRPASIHQMCHNNIKRVNTDMLNRVIPALERITGLKHTLDDVMIYLRDVEAYEEDQILQHMPVDNESLGAISGIKYTLSETLIKYNLSQNELAIQSQTRLATIHQICRSELIRVNIEMLDRIISTLDRLTGEKHSLKDVMIYVHSDKEKDAE